MGRLLCALGLALLLGGCGTVTGIRNERWVVAQRAYTPATSGMGFSSKGSVVFVSTDAVYSVAFGTPSGVQTIEDKELWAQATEGRFAVVTIRHNSLWGDQRDGFMWESPR